MCGIFGFAPRTPLTERMAPFLAWEMEGRGKDSWGCSNGAFILKNTGSIIDSWELPDWPHGGDGFICHTRAASTGAATVENAHPFRFLSKGGNETDYHDWVIGIHNGIVSNHQQMDHKYGRKFEVDSMHIFAHIAEQRDTGELQGWGACAYWLNDTIHLFKFNGGSLSVAKLESGEVVFCSTPEPIYKAARICGGKVKHTYQIDTELLYTIEAAETHPEGGWLLVDAKTKMPFGTRGYYTREAAATTGYSGSCSWDNSRNYGGSYWRGAGTNITSIERKGSGSVPFALDPRGDLPNDDRGATSMKDIGRGARQENFCMALGCMKKINRRAALLCEDHYKEAIEDNKNHEYFTQAGWRHQQRIPTGSCVTVH